MKKILIGVLAFGLLAGCSSNNTTSSTGEKETKKQVVETAKTDTVLSKEEFAKMYSDPKKYKGSKVQFYGKVFVDPQKDDKGTYLQVYADNDPQRNTIVAIKDPNLDVKNNDIVLVTGTVKDQFEGKNALGGTVTGPTIIADKITKSDYATAFAPALKTVNVNKKIDQNGYVLDISKIEIAENETRVYVDITNNSKNTIHFYDFKSKLIINNQQLEPSNNFDANYPKVQTDILSGVTSQGIIIFPKVPQSGSLKVYLEGSSDNYELNFQPFIFDITY